MAAEDREDESAEADVWIPIVLDGEVPQPPAPEPVPELDFGESEPTAQSAPLGSEEARPAVGRDRRAIAELGDRLAAVDRRLDELARAQQQQAEQIERHLELEQELARMRQTYDEALALLSGRIDRIGQPLETFKDRLAEEADRSRRAERELGELINAESSSRIGGLNDLRAAVREVESNQRRLLDAAARSARENEAGAGEQPPGRP